MAAPKGNKFAVGNYGGRPRKVDENNLPDLGEQMISWLKDHLDKLDEWRRPVFISSFAIEHNLSKYNLNDYSDENEEFSNYYKKAKEIVKQILIQGALRGYWNPTAFIFTAKNETDMKDETKFDHTSGGEKIGVVILPNRYENPLATDRATDSSTTAIGG